MDKAKNQSHALARKQMDEATRRNQLMKIAFTTENTWYKARAHATLAARPWHLRNTEHE